MALGAFRRRAASRASTTKIVLTAAFLLPALPALGQIPAGSGIHPSPAQIQQLQGSLAALPAAAGLGLLTATAISAANAPVPGDTNHIRRSRAVDIDPQYLAGMLAGDELRVANGALAG